MSEYIKCPSVFPELKVKVLIGLSKNPNIFNLLLT